MPSIWTESCGMKRLVMVLALALLTPATGWSRGDDPFPRTATGLRASLIYGNVLSREEAEPWRVQHARSVPLSFALSAVVPGLGQAYNRQWIKAGLGLAIEAALLTSYGVWHSRGVDGRDAYRAYAHTSWSPVRYADWLNDYSVWLQETHDPTINVSPILVTEDLRAIDFQHPDAWTTAEQVAIRHMFDQIRGVESHVFHPETGATFSHKLPYFGEQQYYELIGKYFQFAPGWSDYAAWIAPDGTYTDAIDPEQTGPGGSKPNVSAQFLDYADDHGRANDYLRRASRVSLFFVFNHLIAAVDAAVFARLHNNRLQTTLGMTYDPAGEPEPVATIRLSF